MNWELFYAENAPLVSAYSWQHMMYLAVCAVMITLFISNRKRIKANADGWCKLFLSVLLFQQIFLLYGWYAVVTGFDAATALPLHICRVASLLTVIFLLIRKTVLLDVICYFSIFALTSLFYPMNVYHFAHINGISYMVNHLITVLIPIFAMVAYDWRPTWKTYVHAGIGFCIYFPAAMIANAITQTGNYFYQTDRPFLRNMPQWQYSALSFVVTLLGFAVAPTLYAVFQRKASKVK